MFSTFLEKLLDILFPPTAYEREVLALSEETLSRMLRIETVEGVICLFEYKNPLIREMIWMLKYRGSKHVARLCALVLYDYLLEELADRELFDGRFLCVVVPLPLSRERERERGFNQIELITDMLREIGDIPINTTLLKRTKHTKTQTSLPRRERLTNMEGAFEMVKREGPLPRCVILIDDVMTTGSTLTSAKEELERGGIEEVLCIALAH